MASEQYQQVMAMIEAMPSFEDLTLEQQREAAEGFGLLTGPVDDLIAAPVSAGGVPAEWVSVPESASDRVLLYVHGGGYVIGSIAAYRNFAAHLARAAGCRVLNVDYRLAPEHRFPAAVDDSVAAYRWLLTQGVTPSQIAIAGDSAGGGLTLATLLRLRDEGGPLPAGAVPLSPWTDLEGTGETLTTNAATDPLVQMDGLKLMADSYLQGADPRHPHASPLHADYTGLPPLLIQVGDAETLLDDSRRVAKLARGAGVDVTLQVFPEMGHVFQMCAGNVPESDDAVAKIGKWLRALWHS